MVKDMIGGTEERGAISSVHMIQWFRKTRDEKGKEEL
jgi:hypothetical protein